FAEGSFPVRYLGVPLKSSRLLYQDCRVLVEKLKIRASIFILLDSIIHDLEQLMRGFLWCQREMKKGKAKVVWDLSWGWWKLLQSRSRVRPFILHKINSGKSTSMWFDKWNELCPIRGMPSVRDIVRSAFSFTDPVSDLIAYGYWRWPPDWHNRFPNLCNSRLFKKKSATVPQILEVITSIVRLKLVTFKFKKVSTCAKILLEKWKILSSCLILEGSAR
ncbi:hypothetical protein Tco_0081363, partial [Tanacetum coccineum]